MTRGNIQKLHAAGWDDDLDCQISALVFGLRALGSQLSATVDATRELVRVLTNNLGMTAVVAINR